MSRIYAVESGGDQILRGGANRSADTSALKKEPQAKGQCERNAEREQADQRHGGAEKIKVGPRVAGIYGPEIRAEGDLSEIGDHHLESEGDQQSIEHRRADDQVQHIELNKITEAK